MDKVNKKPLKMRRTEKRRESAGAKNGQMWQNLQEVGKKIWQQIVKIGKTIWASLKHLKEVFLRSFAGWVDPKLEPYRERKIGAIEQKAREDGKTVMPSEEGDSVIISEEIYTPVAPESREDLFALIREMPITVLTSQERKAMAAVLSLPDAKVSEIMTPALKTVFVKQDETMGPLTLDRLYRSGFTYFPVIDNKTHIIGTLHTASLNNLDVRETTTAVKIMTPHVYYIRDDYTLEQALKAFLRTNSQIMLVVDHYEKYMGMLTFGQLMDYLFSEKYVDDFDRDDDRLAVAKRKK